MLCQDPLLTYLNKLNYNVVKLPKTGLSPWDCISMENYKLREFGNFKDIWLTEKPFPAPKTRKTAKISSKLTGKIKFDSGMEFLNNILSQLGGKSFEASLIYSGTRSLKLELDKPTEEIIDRAQIGEILKEGKINIENEEVKRLLIDKEGDLFLISQVLKSNKIIVHALDESDRIIKLKVPEIKEIVKGKIKINSSRELDDAIEYIGDGPELTFGFMIYRLKYKNNKIVLEGQDPSGAFALGISDSENIENICPVILEKSTLLDL